MVLLVLLVWLVWFVWLSDTSAMRWWASSRVLQVLSSRLQQLEFGRKYHLSDVLIHVVRTRLQHELWVRQTGFQNGHQSSTKTFLCRMMVFCCCSWPHGSCSQPCHCCSPRPRAKVTSRHIIVIYGLWYRYNIHNICCSLPFTNQFACGRLRFQILHQSTRTWIHRIRPGRSIDLILVVHVSKRSQSSGATTWRPRSPSVFWWANQDLCRSEPWSRLIVLSMVCSKGFIITNNVWTWGPWNRDPKPIHFC